MHIMCGSIAHDKSVVAYTHRIEKGPATGSPKYGNGSTPLPTFMSSHGSSVGYEGVAGLSGTPEDENKGSSTEEKGEDKYSKADEMERMFTAHCEYEAVLLPEENTTRSFGAKGETNDFSSFNEKEKARSHRQLLSKVQFLHFFDQKNHSLITTKPHFLHIVDKEKITLYQCSVPSLTIEFRYILVEIHLWSQFIPYNNNFYVLTLSQKKYGNAPQTPGLSNGSGSAFLERTNSDRGGGSVTSNSPDKDAPLMSSSSNVTAECTLKKWDFYMSPKSKTLETKSLKGQIQCTIAMKLNQQAFNKRPVYVPTPFYALHAIPDRFLNLQIFCKTEKGSGSSSGASYTGGAADDERGERASHLVLYHRHPSSHILGDKKVKMNVYCLLTRYAMNIHITCESRVPSWLPIFVGSLRKKILILYFPDYFIYLVDLQHRSRHTRILLGCRAKDLTRSGFYGVGHDKKGEEGGYTFGMQNFLPPGARRPPQPQDNNPEPEDTTQPPLPLPATETPPPGPRSTEPPPLQRGVSSSSSPPVSPSSPQWNAAKKTFQEEQAPHMESMQRESSVSGSVASSACSPPAQMANRQNQRKNSYTAASPEEAILTGSFSRPLFYCQSVVTIQGALMINMETMSFYTYSLSESALLHFCVHHLNEGNAHEVFHFILTHLSSHSIPAIDVIRSVCQHRPDNVSANMFREYILGAAYMGLRADIKSIDKNGVQGLPVPPGMDLDPAEFAEWLEEVPKTALSLVDSTTTKPGTKIDISCEGLVGNVSLIDVGRVERGISLPVEVAYDYPSLRFVLNAHIGPDGTPDPSMNNLLSLACSDTPKKQNNNNNNPRGSRQISRSQARYSHAGSMVSDCRANTNVGGVLNTNNFEFTSSPYGRNSQKLNGSNPATTAAGNQGTTSRGPSQERVIPHSGASGPSGGSSGGSSFFAGLKKLVGMNGANGANSGARSNSSTPYASPHLQPRGSPSPGDRQSSCERSFTPPCLSAGIYKVEDYMPYEAVVRDAFVEGCIEQIVKFGPDKSEKRREEFDKKVFFVGKMYHRQIVRLVENLIADIGAALMMTIDDYPRKMYNVLRRLSVALDELSLPRPQSLNVQLCNFGLKALTKRAFYQAVASGAVCMDFSTFLMARGLWSQEEEEEEKPSARRRLSRDKKTSEMYLQQLLLFLREDERLQAMALIGSHSEYLMQYHQGVVETFEHIKAARERALQQQQLAREREREREASRNLNKRGSGSSQTGVPVSSMTFAMATVQKPRAKTPENEPLPPRPSSPTHAPEEGTQATATNFGPLEVLRRKCKYVHFHFFVGENWHQKKKQHSPSQLGRRRAA